MADYGIVWETRDPFTEADSVHRRKLLFTKKPDTVDQYVKCWRRSRRERRTYSDDVDDWRKSSGAALGGRQADFVTSAPCSAK